jgi:hypothetical protein
MKNFVTLHNIIKNGRDDNDKTFWLFQSKKIAQENKSSSKSGRNCEWMPKN